MSGRRFAGFLTALAVAVSAFGGLVLPRFAGSGTAGTPPADTATAAAARTPPASTHWDCPRGGRDAPPRMWPTV
jgi:hypothetical protein